MSDLAQKKRTPCQGGTAPLTHDRAHELLGKVDEGWSLAADAGPLRRELSFKDFYRPFIFVNAVVYLANIEDHHPDLEVGYNYCRVVFTTHAVKGLSENDFICAAKIDAIPLK